ncbi:MAG: SusE domain-containing protein [Bacteroidales bacterium]|nr:SusE domain-containing protein [Bacteroidales bacterium]
MKKHILLSALAVLLITGCGKEKENEVLAAVEAQELLMPVDSSSITITASNLDSNLVFSWTPAGYSASFFVKPFYMVQLSREEYFSNPFLGLSVSDTTLKVSCDTLNKSLLLSGVDEAMPVSVYIRVKSHIANQLVQNSNSIILNITPYFAPPPEPDTIDNSGNPVINAFQTGKEQ